MNEFQLTNRQRKEFASLDDSKGRRRAGIFVAEGSKCVLELAAVFRPRHIFATAQWIEEHPGTDATEVAPCVLRQLTRLSTTPPVIAFFELPESEELPLLSGLVLALDCVQDPGNLGTIIRTCDWMGVHTILASRDTVDAFNPKVVQATMGGLARVKVVYCNLPEVLERLKERMPVYGTFLDGENIYRVELSDEDGAVLVMGNEGRGITEATAACVTHRLLIPSYPADAATVESLNVGTATAIALSQFRARK